jgi:hypothetical protein
MGAKRQWATAGVLFLLGCQNDGPRTLRDSEGRTFVMTCKGGGSCRFEQKSGPRREDRPAQAFWTTSRLVGLCDVREGGAPEGPYDCRPLNCKQDGDCPPLHGMKDGQCLNGRCGDPAQDVATADAIMLCLAGSGLGRETPQQIERYALALNCGSPCKVPAPCAQP